MIQTNKKLPKLNPLISETPSLIQKSNTLKSAKLELVKNEEEFKNMKTIRSCKTDQEKQAIKQMRRDKSTLIKKMRSNIKKLSSESKDLVTETEIIKCENLSRNVGFPTKDWRNMDPIEFKKNKDNLMYMALQNYKEHSMLATAGLLQVTQVLDTMPYGNGTQQSVEKQAPKIQECIQRVFIDLGEQDIEPTKYFNPYTTLFLCLSAPIAGVFLSNYMQKNKKHEVKKKPSTIIKETSNS